MSRFQGMIAGMLGLGVMAVGLARAEDKGTTVKIEDAKATAPAEWKEEKPGNAMRFAQFKLPGEDGKDGEIVIFKGLGGGANANIDRWKGMFPEGESKVAEVKVGTMEGKRVDLSGTYMFKAAPFNPNAKAEPRANYKMTALYFEGKTPWQIRMVGPAKTIEKYQKGFDGFVESFK